MVLTIVQLVRLPWSSRLPAYSYSPNPAVLLHWLMLRSFRWVDVALQLIASRQLPQSCDTLLVKLPPWAMQLHVA